MKIKLTDIPTTYINLAEHDARNSNTVNLLKILGFKNITRFNAIKKDQNDEGCAASHSAVLSSNTAPFIIFEDDLVLGDFVDEVEVPDDADALYLGYMWWPSRDIYYRHINRESGLLKFHGAFANHAIAYLSERFVNFTKEKCNEVNSIDKKAFDWLVADESHNFNLYIYNKPMFYQQGKYEELTSYPVTHYGIDMG
jgi:hypothetical protein